MPFVKDYETLKVDSKFQLIHIQIHLSTMFTFVLNYLEV